MLLTCKSCRLIALDEAKDIHDTSVAEAAFEVAWEKILGGQPLVCAKTGTQFDPAPARPSAAVLDVGRTDKLWSMSSNELSLAGLCQPCFRRRAEIR